MTLIYMQLSNYLIAKFIGTHFPCINDFESTFLLWKYIKIVDNCKF